MDWLHAFWAGNREEILVTVGVILAIQLLTGAGGLIKRRASSMERLEDRQ